MSSFGCKSLCIVINYLVLKASTRVYPFNEISATDIFFQKPFRSSGVFFLFFLSLLVWRHPLPIFLIVIFLFTKRSDFSLIKQFCYFRCFSFPPFRYQHSTLFRAKFNSYTLALYLIIFLSNLNDFFIFCK